MRGTALCMAALKDIDQLKLFGLVSELDIYERVLESLR
jgi:hypothetical protein